MDSTSKTVHDFTSRTFLLLTLRRHRNAKISSENRPNQFTILVGTFSFRTDAQQEDIIGSLTTQAMLETDSSNNLLYLKVVFTRTEEMTL